MKRKWLIGLFALMMAIAMCFGFVACGGDNGGNNDNPPVGGDETQNDEEIADKAISFLKQMYKDGETAAAYKVLGQAKVDDKLYDVTWTVTSTTDHIENYVKIGTMDETTKQLTIDIIRGEEEIEYTLTASVTVGSVTKTLNLKRTIPASGKIYTPSEALALGKTLTHAEGSHETYYQVEGVVTPITVRGYVVYIDPTGGWSSEYKNLNKVYIGDTPETSQSNALYVYRIVADEVYLTGPDSIEVGDLVTLNGALELYYNTVELTYNGSISVTVQNIQKAEKTDESTLNAAKEALRLPVNYFSKTGDYDLPTPADGVTVTWALEGGNNENVKVENGKITVLAIPDNETSYTLKATLSYGSATPVTKDFTIKLGHLAVTHAGTQTDPYTPAEAIAIANTLAENAYYSDENGTKAVYVRGKVVDTGSWSGGNYNNYNKIYIIAVDDYTASATKDTEGAILVYRIANDSRLSNGTLHHGDEVLLQCGIQNYQGNTPELGAFDGTSSNACTLVEYKPTEISDDVKAQEVLDAITIPETLSDDYDLPASLHSDVTLTFESNNTAALEVKDGKFVIHRTASAATVTITATAKIGSVTKTKTFTVTVPAELNVPADATTASVNMTEYATAHSWKAAGEQTYEEVEIDENVKVTLDVANPSSYGQNSGKYYITNDVGNWRIYYNENVTIKFQGVEGVTIYTIKITYDSNVESNGGVLVNKADQTIVYASEAEIDVNAQSFEFSVGVTGHIRIKAIEVVYDGGTPAAPETDEQKVDKALNTLTDKTIDATTDLPATSGEVAFTWTTDTVLPAGIAFENNKITVTERPEADTDIVFTVKATLNSTEKTKTVTYTVKAKPAAGQEGELELTEALATSLSGGYKTGTFDANGTSVTVSNVAVFNSVYVDNVSTDVGYNFLQFKKDGSSIELSGEFTKIVTVMLSNARNAYDANTMLTIMAGTTKLAITKHTATETKISTADYYLYTEEYEVTTSGSQKITITNANAGFALYAKTITLTGTASGGQGGEQPGPGGDQGGETVEFTALDAPTAGDFIYSVMNKGKRRYASSLTLSKNYIATTDDVTKAVKFTLETQNDHWYIKMGDQYLEVDPYNNNSKVSYSLRLVATPTEGAYWEWDSEIKIFKQKPVADEAGVTPADAYFYIGMRDNATFDTMSPSDIKFITGDNAGECDVSQHPSRFGTVGEAKEPTADEKIAAAKTAVEQGKVDVEATYTATNGEGAALPAEYNGATLAWAVKDAANHTNYVKIENGKLVIVALPAEEDYHATLVATITCEGGTQATAEFEITIKAQTSVPAGNDGTAAKPYTPGEAVAYGKQNLPENGNTTANEVYIKGYVIDAGSWKGTYWQYVYIADDASYTTSKNADNVIEVYKLYADETYLILSDDLLKGREITVHGYLKNYTNKTTTYEFDDYTKDGGTVHPVASAASTLTREQKLAAAKTAVGDLTNDDVIAGFDLPVPTVSGISYAWSVTPTTYANVATAEGKSTLNITRPENGSNNQNVTLSLIITCDGTAEETPETWQLTIKQKPSTTEESELYILPAAHQNSGSNNGYAGNCDVTYNGITWNIEGNSQMSPWRFGGKEITGTDRKLTGKTAIQGKVSKVLLTLTDSGSITVNSVTLKVYDTDPTASGATAKYTKTATYTKGETITFEAGEGEDWSNCYYQIIFNVTVGSSNKYVAITNLEFRGTALAD